MSNETTFSIPDDPKQDVIDCDGDLWEYDHQTTTLYKHQKGSLYYRWVELLIKYGPLTPAPKQPDPWDNVRKDKWYLVSGGDSFTGEEVTNAIAYARENSILVSGHIKFWKDYADRLDSAVELVAFPREMWDRIVENAGPLSIQDAIDWLEAHGQEVQA